MALMCINGAIVESLITRISFPGSIAMNAVAHFALFAHGLFFASRAHCWAA